MSEGARAKKMKSLYFDIRREQNLFSAWRHVKRSAQNSKNKTISGNASEFEHQHQKYLRKIAAQLRENRFKFSEAEGVLKDKKSRQRAGKSPRPIAIATITDRVVQRAILQILQPRSIIDPKQRSAKFHPRDDYRIGKLNLIDRSPFGVGGLMRPYGGIEPAITLIMEAISDGALYFYKSDIKGFYDHIPTQKVVDIVLEETNDEFLADLFSEGLKVNLANKDILKEHADLFPSDGIGVAQGSSLSTFAGNTLLYDFDHHLNSMGVTAVRYIDDLLIVSKSEKELESAIKYCADYLGSLNLSLYKAAPGSEKADKGKCRNGFNFLGCTIQINRCVPSNIAIKKTQEAIRKDISDSKMAIKNYINSGKSFDPKLSRSSVLHMIGKRVFGWEKAYSFCTDAQAFKQMDTVLQDIIIAYDRFVHRTTNGCPPDKLLTILGVPSTEALYKRDSSLRKK